jgi:hypothetical protein
MALHTNQVPDSRPRGEARAHLRTLLADAERVARGGGTLGADTREALRTAAIEAAPLPRSLGRRLSGVMSTDALRTRQAPREELSGLTDDVMRIAEGERFARARMSGAYLDVPEALRFWRRVAFGATCVLVIGVLWSTQASPPHAARPLHGNSALEPLDPRNQLRLLTPFDPQDGSKATVRNATMTPAGTAGERNTPFGLPERLGPGSADMGSNGVEIFTGSGGNVFFIDPSGRTRLRVGFGAPRPAAPSAPESPERN